jgi:CRISPR-associated protein Cas1
VQLLKSLYVTDHASRVSVRKDALEVHVEGRLRGRFPIHGLEAVTLVGRAGMTTDAIARCVDARVRVVSLTMSGRIRFVASPGTTGNVHLRLAQYAAAVDREGALQLASHFVAGKLQNQRRAVMRWSADAPSSDRRFLDNQRQVIEERLGSSRNSATGDHLRGYEGDATRRYFKALGAHLARVAPTFPLLARTRRPPADPVNCALSFAYGLLLAESIGALEGVGLDPQVGFLHTPRPGRPSLALDLVEEFRTPVADRVVVSLLSRRQLRLEHFQSLSGRAWYLSDEGRRVMLAAFDEHRERPVRHALLGREVPRGLLTHVQATLLARHLRGDLPVYPPFVMPT